MALFGSKKKLNDGLAKTRTGFWGNIWGRMTGSEIDDDLYDDLEEQLILADTGVEVAVRLVDGLRDAVRRQHLTTGDEALAAL